MKSCEVPLLSAKRDVLPRLLLSDRVAAETEAGGGSGD